MKKKIILFLYKKGNDIMFNIFKKNNWTQANQCLVNLCAALGLDADGDVFTAFRPHGNPVIIYINIKDSNNPILKVVEKEEKSK